MNKRLLLLSNSTMVGEQYLGWPEHHIKDFLKDVKKVLFIPYAGVTISYDEYAKVVSERFNNFGYHVDSIHQINSDDISGYGAIIIGGGNTFQLAHQLQKNNLMKRIRREVDNGMPYIGWSAGANIACPTIMTTNDMPIVEPVSFDGLGLVPFQINPHYTEATIPNHGGESRDMRIKEFVSLNKNSTVVALPEGSLLRCEKNELHFYGVGPCKLFSQGNLPKQFFDGYNLSSLLKS